MKNKALSLKDNDVRGMVSEGAFVVEVLQIKNINNNFI